MIAFEVASLARIYLAEAFDTLEKSHKDDDPSQEETKGQVGAQRSGLVDALRDAEHIITAMQTPSVQL
jgi:hypothetical protein